MYTIAKVITLTADRSAEAPVTYQHRQSGSRVQQ